MDNERKTQSVDLKSYWAVIIRRRALIILPLFIVPLMAVAVTYFLKPSYASTVTVFLSDSNILPSTVQLEVDNPRDRVYPQASKDEKQTAFYNQITSASYLKRLVAVQNIPVSEKVKKEAAKIKADYPSVSEGDVADNLLADNLRKHVTVNLRANNVLEITFSATDPVAAQKMAASLAQIFIEENLAKELEGVKSNISFSEDQLTYYRDKLKDAEDKMKNYREGILASSAGQDTSATNVREIASASEALDYDIARLQDNRASLRTDLNSKGVNVASINLPADIQSQKARLLAGASRLSVLLTNYSWKDAKIVSLNEESRGIFNQISGSISEFVDRQYASQPEDVKQNIVEYLVDGVSIDFDSAKRGILNGNIGRFRGSPEKNPAVEITMDRLQSEIDSYKKFYDLFVAHSQSAAIDQSAKKVEAEAKYTVIKPATLPIEPDFPKRFKILAMGLALGLCIGFGAVMMVEFLDSSFKSIEDLTAFIGLPVIGTIPRIDLPYSDTSRRRTPVVVGVSVSILLMIFIAFMHFSRR